VLALQLPAGYQVYKMHGNVGLLPGAAVLLLTFSFLCKRNAVTPITTSNVLYSLSENVAKSQQSGRKCVFSRWVTAVLMLLFTADQAEVNA